MKVFRPLNRKIIAGLALLELATLAMFNQPVALVAPSLSAKPDQPSTIIVQQPSGGSAQQLVVLCVDTSQSTCPSEP
jgi:hypothetical protein